MHGPKRHESTLVHGNMFGFRGVEWRQDRGKYRARIEPANGRRGRWLGTFDTAEEAARAYDAAARETYGVHAYLNFPDEGERATIPSLRALGVCAKGHLLSEHGYVRPDGDGMNCRACNRAAARRSYAKRRLAKEAMAKRGE